MPRLPGHTALSRVLLLHRFDDGEIEQFVSRILVPELCNKSVCFRIRTAGFVPGEAGYWLQVFQLLSGLVDAVISVEFTSEAHSESIFFEQVLVPKLRKGETVRQKLFEAHAVSHSDTQQLSRVPVCTLAVLDSPGGEYFVWPDPARHFVKIDVRYATPDALLACLKKEVRVFIADVEEARQYLQHTAPRVAEDQERLFWGLLRHPMLVEAISIDAPVDAHEWLQRRAFDDEPAQRMADAVAHQLLHDPDALAWWSQMAEKISEGDIPRSPADKIAVTEAKRWQWIVGHGAPSIFRAALYKAIWYITTHIKIMRYRRLVASKS